MADYNDIKQDFDDAYQEAFSAWGEYLAQAKNDLGMLNQDQWENRWVRYLKAQGRDTFVFNRIRRVIESVAGYEARNRLVFKVVGTGPEDDETASQLSKVLMNVMDSDSGLPWITLSDAFKLGPLTAGLGLIETWPEPWEGDIKVDRIPYSEFLLSPHFKRRDLKDCPYLLRRKRMTDEQARFLLPEIKPKNDGKGQAPTDTDDKYPYLNIQVSKQRATLRDWDEFWRRTTKMKSVLINRFTGKQTVWNGTQDDLKAFELTAALPNGMPVFATVRRPIETVELSILWDGNVVWTGAEPYGLNDYKYTPVFGYFCPEAETSDQKIISLARIMRDPQIARNKRVSQIADIIETQIHTGWAAEEDSFVDEAQAYRSGQGQTIWFKEGALSGPAGPKAVQLKPSDIPVGLFHMVELLDREISEDPGANDELMGTENKDIPAFLGKMRQGAALTILQHMFDSWRYTKQCAGLKMLKLIQNKRYYPTAKVKRILNSPPTPEFYDAEFTKWDCTLVEGLLTENQRQMAVAEALMLKEMGARTQDPCPIPWSFILENSSVLNTSALKKHMQAAEQAMQQQQQKQYQEEVLTQKMKQAKIATDIAGAEESRTQAAENMATAALSRVKTMAEIQEMGTNRVKALADIVQGFEKNKIDEKKVAKQAKQTKR